jgi:NAD(P)-dependent dehydrogenase (short-subunit alcohol dehydrogenase family)
MNWSKDERVLILGGSRGLGQALVEGLTRLTFTDLGSAGSQPEDLPRPNLEVISISRKSHLSMDFSKKEAWPGIVNRIFDLNPTRIIYVAAGGPYGAFQKFEWKDHDWAFHVTFLFPSFLLHETLRSRPEKLKQLALVGSSVAESSPDPGAASYCAAKHALRGLVTSLQLEGPPFDLRLLSPGYMVTDLLPRDSAPRLSGRARDPRKIAALMIQSISDPALRMKNQSFD